MTPLGMEELFWKQNNSLWGHALSPVHPVRSSPSLKVQINLFGWDLEQLCLPGDVLPSLSRAWHSGWIS